MPSRLAKLTRSLVTLAASCLATAAVGQELMLPESTSGGSIAESITPPSQSGSGTRSVISDSVMTNTAPMSPDATLLEGAPASAFSSGQVYNPTLGAHIRARYNTQSYGQQEGTLDLGTMKLMEVDGGIAFLDGQVTMNDDSGVGYNLGLGYRWLTLPMFPFSPDDEKIMGVSLWSDGQTLGQENFFNQIGVSFELLGERLDFRANGYAPIGPRTRTRDFAPTGDFTFSGNGVAQQLMGIEDTALTVGEAELAGRLGDLDAWLFGGVYGFNGGRYDGVGGKVGLRGYATPDLLLSIAVANDDEFDTNAVFSATWFIGRTRAENCPTGVLTDRFREPVLRNQYIASQQRDVLAAGDALIDANGDPIRIVHVDSTAAAGGDGSFANPLNNLNDINSNSQEGDIILAHGGSDFNDQTATLMDDQTFFGEGNDVTLAVNSDLFGSIDLPETAPGAASGAIPTIAGPAASAGVILDDNNLVQNLAFDGGQNAIVTDTTNGSFNPVVQDVTVTGTSGDAFVFNTVTRADIDDIDDDDNTSETLDVLDSVTISDTTFTNVMGRDIVIDGDEANAQNADVNNGVTVAINDVTSTGNMGGASISVTNTTGTTGDSVTIDNYTYDGGTGGALFLENTGGSATVTNSDFMNGSGPALEARSTDGVITVGATNDVTDLAGDVLVVNANTASISFDADVMTASTVSGGGIRITANEANVDVGGDLELNNDSIEVLNAKADVDLGSASGGTVQDGTIIHSGTGDLFVITEDNTDADTDDSAVAITVTADVTNNAGGGHVAVVSGGNDSVVFTGTVTDNGQGIDISGLEANTINGTAANGTVEFRQDVELNTTTFDAVTLAANNEDSVVSFDELMITTTSGNGIVASGDGELNITGNDGATPTSNPTSTITTDTGRALFITGGSSTNGIAFADVTTGSVALGEEAVDVRDFDGTVTIVSGTMESTGDVARFTNTSFVLGGDDADPLTFAPGAGNNAVNAIFNDDVTRTLTMSEIDAGGGNVQFTTSGDATTTANLTDIANGGELGWTASGANASTLNVTDAAFATGYDFDATGDGGLAVVMNNDDDTLTGGAVAFNTSGANNSSLAINDLASTGGFTFVDGSSGTLDVDVTDSTAVGDIAFTSSAQGASTLDLTDFTTGAANDYDYTTTGDGGLAVTMTDIVTSGGGAGGRNVTFNSGGEGASSLSIGSAELTGTFDYDVTGDGDLAIDMTDVDSTGVGGVLLDVTDDGSATLDLTRVDVLGPFAFNGTAGGDATVTMNTVTGVGGVSHTTSGSGNGSLTMTDVDMSGAGPFDFDVTGDGNLTVAMTDVTGTGDLTLDVAGAGNGSLTANNVETGGNALTANGSAASSGDVSLSVTDSGDATGGEFTSVVVNQQGSGAVSATLTDVEATSGIDFDSASDTSGSLTVIDGTYGGAVTVDDTGDGDVSVSLTNVNVTGGVTINEASDGNASLTMSGGEYTAGIDVTETGSGDAFVSLTNVDADPGGGVNVSESNDGSATLTMSGGDYAGGVTFLESGAGDTNASLTNVTATGAVDFDASGTGNNAFAVSGGTFGGAITADVAAGSTGSFAASVTNGTVFTAGSQVAFNGQNSGTVTYEVSGLDPTFNTGAAVPGIDLTVGSTVTSGDITVSSNLGAQTLDAALLNLDIDGGNINFLMTGNDFDNASATETVLVSHTGGTLNATVTGNTLNNSGAGTEFELTNSVTSRTNLLVSNNGPAGSDYEFINSSGSALDFNVRGSDAASVDSANDGNVTFTGVFTFDPNLNVPTP